MRTWRAVAVLPAMALAGLLGATAAQARTDVHWSITIGSPAVVRPAPVYYPAPVYLPPPPPVVVLPAPVYVAPRPVAYLPAPVYHAPRPVYPGYRPARWQDRDADGVPDHRDRAYDPYGDRDRDGVPNRWDRHDRDPWRR